MKRRYKTRKWIRVFAMKARYAAKRHTSRWKNRKRFRKFALKLRVHEEIRKQKQDLKPFINHVAPKNFSLIGNTNEVLKYFKDAEKIFKRGDNVGFDISKVDVLTSDALALLVASIKDPDFTHGGSYKGNTPEKPDLEKLFMESGFGDHVSHHWERKTNSSNNLLHKETHNKVEPRIAEAAFRTGLRHVKKKLPFEPLYNTLIECMSNTNNHANLEKRGKCKWWLYVFSDPKRKVAAYSFLDLGVGIFKSAVVQDKLKKMLKGSILYPYVNLVDDLLDGNIQSRVDDEDQRIRGKGIPEIVGHAKLDDFKAFYIITNNVKVDLKTRAREELKYDLDGTFLYWELV